MEFANVLREVSFEQLKEAERQRRIFFELQRVRGTQETFVNNTVANKIQSKRNKVWQFNCDMQRRNLGQRKRCLRKMWTARVAEAKKKLAREQNDSSPAKENAEKPRKGTRQAESQPSRPKGQTKKA